ncbi:hypothetical protein TWF106_004915 [Orbilia oligospora]|uniref:BTB domain-containing protein n=1 Tax=Orbilia oligospora TaxID=2813651 RepID=A0A6G1MCH1_ORBOL|nr:hypothetical protein TWF679_008328 [Orbilia oligospora]KAF3223524.1 hypothetical protein TWF106_004915 [Orbilia oligospora]KAF3229004.1 hypothetical protein TWF191_002113 [Orbilia oligospora]KAF3252655.1 hypothetical protein TWF192_004456 [Orbilia oligospora]
MSSDTKEGGSTLARLLESSLFTDIKVFAGLERQEFNLHRGILSVNSEFFKIACQRDRFKEGNSGEVELPEIKADVFSLVVIWLYDGGFTFPDDYREIVTEVYRAAEFLQIPRLQTDVVQAVVNFSKAALPGTTETSEKNRYIFFGFFVRFCTVCKSSDLPLLIECAQECSTRYNFCPTLLLTQFEDKSTGIFAAAIMGVKHVKCGRCLVCLEPEKLQG